MITFVFALIKDLLLTLEYPQSCFPHCVKFLHPATWEHSTITKMSHWTVSQMKINSRSRTNPVILLEQCLCYACCDPSSSPRHVSCQKFSDPSKKVVLCLLALCVPQPLDLKHGRGFLALPLSLLWCVRGWFLRPHTVMSLNAGIKHTWAHIQKCVLPFSVFILEY